MLNSIRIVRLDDRIDDLNQEVAILRGKINQTANFTNLPLPTSLPSSKEIKSRIKSKIRNIKGELKADKKLNKFKAKYQKQKKQEILLQQKTRPKKKNN